MDCLDRITRTEFNAQASALVSSQRTLWTAKSHVDELLEKHLWLQASQRLARNGRQIFETVYVFYNANYQQPQLGFSPSIVDDNDDDVAHIVHALQAVLPRITLLNVSNDADSTRNALPVASYSFCEEVGAPLWLVHPCDTSHLMSCGRLDGIQGDVLSVFLRVMAPYAELQAHLLPPSV